MQKVNPESLKTFLVTPSDRPKLVVVYGPTACGKTGLAIDIAEAIDGEIIGADSRQIYRYLDIGTGKATQEEMRGIVHHGLDLVDPREHYSVGLYDPYATDTIDRIHTKGKIPILCGGTGLYIDVIAYGFDAPETPPDWEYRTRLEAERRKHGNLALWGRIRDQAPETAAAIHPDSTHRVIRTLELLHHGFSLSRKRDYSADTRYDVLWLTPYDGDRASLYERINRRVRGMFDGGFVEETEALLARGYLPTDPGLDAIGYREVCAMLAGVYSLDTCIALVQQGNRHYARRQITWFRRYPA